MNPFIWQLFRNFKEPLTRFRGTSVVPKANFQATVDKSDVARHSKLAEEWWDPLGPMKGLHSMNDLRIALIRNGLINEGKLSTECLKSPLSLKGIKILDVGCGGGILSIPLSRIGANVTGIDPSEELIEIAKSKASEDGTITDRIHFTRTTIEEYSETNKEVYDAVVLSEVVEHVNSKYEFLKYSVGTLKPGGSIFITTINKTFASWSLAICTAEYLLGLLPKGTHEWSKFISPNELTSYLECVGCTTRLVNGLIYVPFQNRWYWSAYDGINYGVHAVKCKKME